MEREVRIIQTPGFDTDYWLCRCEGFQVDTGEGRLGTVEWLVFRSRHDRPDMLAVRAGRIVHHSLVIPVSEIADVVPTERRITVAPNSTQPGRVETLRRWLVGTGRRARASVGSAGGTA